MIDELLRIHHSSSAFGGDLMLSRLSATMSVSEFENGYWYVQELRDFARHIGIPEATRLRKDEIERALVTFLRTGTVKLPTQRALRETGAKDFVGGLSLNLQIKHYTSNRETKDFIVREAKRMAPEIREKSGVWYRLNRWREDQITNGNRPTYGDLVQQYVLLNHLERFEKVPHGRYINFVAEFLRTEKGSTRSEAIAAWAELKTMNTRKDYGSYAKTRRKREKGNR